MSKSEVIVKIVNLLKKYGNKELEDALEKAPYNDLKSYASGLEVSQSFQIKKRIKIKTRFLKVQ